MDYNPKGRTGQTGGSDGCLNFADPDNAGLKPCLTWGEHGVSLQDAYKSYCTSVSLADFIVIAGEAVMTVTRPDYPSTQTEFKNQFSFGRKSVTECSWNVHLPNPEEGCDATDKTFNKQMGLSWRYSAALMGVHSLGRAQKENSGYEGWWSDAHNSRIFNNNYYTSLIVKGWMPQRIGFETNKELTDMTEHFQNCGVNNSLGCTKVQWIRSDNW